MGITAFAGLGSPPRDAADALADAVFLGADERRIDPLDLARAGTAALGSLELTWLLCGARFLFRGGSVSLELLQELERVEAWDGDLLGG